METSLYCVRTGCRRRAVHPLVRGGYETLCDRHSPVVVAELYELIEAIGVVLSDGTEDTEQE